jgi:ribose transport system substrate-binding protein
VLTKVAVAPPDESNGVAGQTFSSLLTKYPQATAVWTPDDSLIDAAQIPQAIASAGRLQSLLVLGVQGFAQNLALIRDNKGQSVAVAYDPARNGWGGMDEANRILNGMPSVLEGNGLQVIDATHNMPPAGQNWKDPINYESAYEKAWGQG